MQRPELLPIFQQLLFKQEINLEGNIQDGQGTTRIKTEPFKQQVKENHHEKVCNKTNISLILLYIIIRNQSHTA
jgi:hypothetical protein